MPLLRLLSCLFLLPGLALAEPSMEAGQWTVVAEGPLAAAVTQAEGGERLGLLCLPDQDDCRWFLKPAWTCEDGKPLLLRLEGEQGILRLGGNCTATPLGPVVLLDNDLATFVRGSPSIEVSLVSPARERVTLRFGNHGAAAAIEKARQGHAAHRAAPPG